ncbi:hypothetical protein [Clostridium sp.]|uniref:hypothetical protein n=1 Tax=Clostridium sp. TaxID=1506 RepID=UPI00283AC885|nr:hypothetical protein [Clostridium sp.]MDR3594469.1 hypothetical protein [Clostridium sp.]
MGTLEKSSYALMKRAAMLQYGTFLHIRTFLADGLVIFLNMPNLMNALRIDLVHSHLIIFYSPCS